MIQVVDTYGRLNLLAKGVKPQKLPPKLKLDHPDRPKPPRKRLTLTEFGQRYQRKQDKKKTSDEGR